MAPKRTCECGECKKCKKRVYMAGWYRKNAERHRETARQSKLRNAERVRDYNHRYWAANSHKWKEHRKAQNAMNKAVARGDLKRGPCERAHEESCRGRIEGITMTTTNRSM